jgi:predicted ester cyclase
MTFYTNCLTPNVSSNLAHCLGEICTDDFLSLGIVNKSKEGLIAQISKSWRQDPTMKWDVQDLIVDGNKVVVKALVTCAPVGLFMGLEGLDGSASFSMLAMHLLTLDDLKLKCLVHLEDWASALKQLGGS